MIHRSSSWSSWSKTSSDGDAMSQEDLDRLHRQMEEETRRRVEQPRGPPPNVEPGFEHRGNGNGKR